MLICRSKNKKYAQKERSQVEDVLQEFGVCMGQYHGRVLEGAAVRRILANACEIFDRTTLVLCEHCSDDMKDEIVSMCGHNRTLFELLEGATHFCAN